MLNDVDHVVLNGDTLDTRAGPHPERTARALDEVRTFTLGSPAPITMLTGNHDPDVSTNHWTELLGGEVLALHGDVLFDDIVPWGRDAQEIRTRISARLGGADVSVRDRLSLDERSAVWRSVAASIPQRHQSERRALKYAARFVLDTVWPPTRMLQIFKAWRTEPARAAALVRRHRPKARYILLGHTHRPLIRALPGGPVVINTGSFCAPFGGYTVELHPPTLRIRKVELNGRDFRPGATVAEFPLANR